MESDPIPNKSATERALLSPVLDADGKKRLFKSLLEGDTDDQGSNKNNKVLVIFIRHFFCGVSNHILGYQ
jgi:hypothetical protein